MNDQAEILRKLVESKEIRKNYNPGLIKIYSVVSGKGGVGKTNLSVNLAISMAQSGKKVLLMDADIGMTNADILLGINYKYDLFDHLESGVDLKEIIYEGPEGIKFVSGGAGLLKMETLNEETQKKFIQGLLDIGGFDVMIIDNGAGISRESLSFITFAHEVILVTTPEPTAVTDAYRVLKAISFYQLKSTVKLVVNKVSSIDVGEETYGKLYNTAKSFLTVDIENSGYIFDDSRVEKAIMEQEPVVLAYPGSLASGNIKLIASSILDQKNYTGNVSTLKQLGNRFLKIFGS
ncbi:MinD/ParA family protein [Alkalibacter mobilis]|uniref:MinD/ParA family protein n=1 Tax=Alkalibacter mobilis TaxID=2787712 RepID=UPI0018A01457|nr:MinD/ParA family protein [Alkalibacter mobilis]MBF7096304.1 MinD/ParA family protein [Alkalibacter mobilis]